jgi:hypothetical protein
MLVRIRISTSDPDADPGGPKQTDHTDPDANSEHWYIYIILQR